ncbi:MAG: carboxypeptidase-like regulatory domain-containing protein [Saprospiraceae bacterium]
MKKILLAFSFFLRLRTIAQTASLSGTVKEASSGVPLIGANVIVLGTSKGSSTDVDGSFTIYGLAPKEYQVEISYTGYSTVTETVTVQAGGTTVEFQLAEGVTFGQQVVVPARKT